MGLGFPLLALCLIWHADPDGERNFYFTQDGNVTENRSQGIGKIPFPHDFNIRSVNGDSILQALTKMKKGFVIANNETLQTYIFQTDDDNYDFIWPSSNSHAITLAKIQEENTKFLILDNPLL